MKFAPLPRAFFEPSAEVVAARLLGHWLIRKFPEGYGGGPIVETEAYLTGDPASHGFGGETARNRSMYGPPGLAYVYLIYGFHHCVNAVCQERGRAEAVLIRAIEAQFGGDIMQRHRNAPSLHGLTNGPGKLCAALAINRKLDGVDLCDSNSALVIACNPEAKAFRRARGPVEISRRIGISRAADLPLRFFLGKSPFISHPRQTIGKRASGQSGRTARTRPKR